MGKKALEVLKAGLTRLKQQVKTRKETLSARLFNKNEHNMYDDGTEEEIHQAVLERRNREKNDGHGVEDGSDEVTEVKPSRREALAAASTLSKYVADLDEPFARKLEVILASFGRQTRLAAVNSLRPTTLTEFFAFQDA